MPRRVDRLRFQKYFAFPGAVCFRLGLDVSHHLHTCYQVPYRDGENPSFQLTRQPPADVPTGQSNLGNFSIVVFLSDDPMLCQVEIQAN